MYLKNSSVEFNIECFWLLGLCVICCFLLSFSITGINSIEFVPLCKDLEGHMLESLSQKKIHRNSEKDILKHYYIHSHAQK